MSQGFYEMLGVRRTSTSDEIRQAFQARLAALVRRLKAARKQGADVSLLESQERALREAMEILADPARRRRYDAFRDIADGEDVPTDASELWEQCRGSLMDPASVAALNAVRAITELPVGEPISGLPPRQQLRDTPPPAPPPQPAPISSGPPPLQMAQPSLLPPEIDDLPPLAPTIQMPPPSSSVRPQRPRHHSGHGISDHGISDHGLSNHGLGGRRLDLHSMSGQDTGNDVESLARRYGYDGRFLRAVRESQGMSLENLSRATRISMRYLEALEGNAFDRLPSKVFVRGYVREVARELDIDDTDVVERYVSLFEHHGG